MPPPPVEPSKKIFFAVATLNTQPPQTHRNSMGMPGGMGGMNPMDFVNGLGGTGDELGKDGEPTEEVRHACVLLDWWL